MMWKISQQAWHGILDLIYPPMCLVCETAGPPLCDSCAATFIPIPEPVCDVCGRPVEPESNCRQCAIMNEIGGWSFDAARAAAVHQGALRHAIHRFKYRGAESLGEPLGMFLANRCVAEGLLSGLPPRTLVIPVPIHLSRERERGFNQSAYLAAAVAEMLNLPYLPRAVQRVSRTTPQVGLSSEARRRNLAASAFAVADAAPIIGQDILLVDDVFTTGATVSACAQVLGDAGAASVVVVTLAAGG